MTKSAKRTYHCPHCHASLSELDGALVKLAGTLRAENFSVRTMFHLPSTLGTYGAIASGEIDLRPGARVEFACPDPRCGIDLTAPYNHDLAEITMIDEDRREFSVLFNKIFGKHMTFVLDVRQKKVVSALGEDAVAFERTVNFFGV